MVLGAHIEMCVGERSIFLEKFPSGKIDQKWSNDAQKCFFLTFQESLFISFIWKCGRMKVLMTL